MYLNRNSKLIKQTYYIFRNKNYNNVCKFNSNGSSGSSNGLLYLKNQYCNTTQQQYQQQQQHNNNNLNSIENEKIKLLNSNIASSYNFEDGKRLTFHHNMVSGDNYEDAYNSFKWTIPEYFNIGTDICDKHLNDKRDHKAIIYEDEHHNIESVTFGELYEQSNQLANALKEYGIGRGERVGVLLSQGIETALSHISVFRMGGVSIPLFTLFGPEGLVYRLSNAEASCVLTDHDNLPKLLSIQSSLPNLKKIIVFGKQKNNHHHNNQTTQSNRDNNFVIEWNKVKNNFSNQFKPVQTKSEDPALIIFTSGTTDWAWIGGLIDVLLPSLYYGVTVLAHRASKFDPKKISDLMLRHNVTTCFLPPTALKMMRQVHDLPVNTKMISIGSGGESLGDQLLDFGRRVFNVTINEFYGQTEANLLVGNCSLMMPVKNGSMGKPIPGHRVAIVSDEGELLPQGVVGNIALETPDPVVFLRYWNNDSATQAKYKGRWLLTGDLGKVDKDGYYWYVGRDDDIINSSGYRIGPSEIEHCILRHDAVAMCGVVGVPDEIRGEVVKAYIVLKESVKSEYSNKESLDQLKSDIQKMVRDNLAAYEYPRLIEFIDSLPMTTTGKIVRKDLRELHSKSLKN
ncbi:putative acetyl-CoA synthetase [Heterostelium album PN500]|uniref:medium-chain acyl-CoA ligase n=1 Tax=Heterostelium pallidum (strain ATCC 26659 / Pp 5 / PN500) TaxID=670386 RepID=D3BE74_HETP5|nr:putative acetyl-CoA synthetase [Heterostelium album PN500]EFA80205.1 putative acetyl-CoA synthetase [Heterostelium album PN500]|eukprot:XP_020432325.1 putative acetyl-CoA synthetase [Heterostelium album PN500]